jgi:hypothetical protein
LYKMIDAAKDALNNIPIEKWKSYLY